jgi:hypothetical protein
VVADTGFAAVVATALSLLPARHTHLGIQEIADRARCRAVGRAGGLLAARLTQAAAIPAAACGARSEGMSAGASGGYAHLVDAAPTVCASIAHAADRPGRPARHRRVASSVVTSSAVASSVGARFGHCARTVPCTAPVARTARVPRERCVADGESTVAPILGAPARAAAGGGAGEHARGRDEKTEADPACS